MFSAMGAKAIMLQNLNRSKRTGLSAYEAASVPDKNSGSITSMDGSFGDSQDNSLSGDGSISKVFTVKYEIMNT